MSGSEAALSREADDLLAKAAVAAAAYREYDRSQVAEIVQAVAAAALEQAEPLAKRAAEETGFGVVADKILKNQSIARAFLEEYNQADFCTHRVDANDRLLRIPRPAGVVLGVTPSTSPVAALCFKVLCALLTRNAIVISPHPAAKRVCADTARLLAGVAERAGAPRDTVQVLAEPSIPVVEGMMADPRTKLVIATGGGAVVQAAYRSGTPAIGVGPGNAPVLVDETADPKKVAEQLVLSKSFDNGVLCTTESVLVAVEAIADRLLTLLVTKGAYLCSEREVQLLRDYLYPGGHFNAQVVGRPAAMIARDAGFSVPDGAKILVTPISSVRGEEPLTHEKLSPVLAFRRVPDFTAALSEAKSILDVSGIGHSAVIHSEDAQRVLDYSCTLQVHRIAVNGPGSLGNAGFGTRLPISMSLGTGYVGGSSSSENLNPEHFVQWSSVAYTTKVFDRFPDFTALTRSRSDIPSLRLPVAAHVPAAPLGREELRRIVLEELRELIGARP